MRQCIPFQSGLLFNSIIPLFNLIPLIRNSQLSPVNSPPPPTPAVRIAFVCRPPTPLFHAVYSPPFAAAAFRPRRSRRYSVTRLVAVAPRAPPFARLCRNLRGSRHCRIATPVHIPALIAPLQLFIIGRHSAHLPAPRLSALRRPPTPGTCIRPPALIQPAIQFCLSPAAFAVATARRQRRIH